MDLRILGVPHDNDLQSMYTSASAGPLTDGTSCYATAVYDDVSRRGLVMGFLEHDLWKAGVQYRGSKLTAVAGLNGEFLTRDVVPHGSVTTTEAPLLSIGVYEDWRQGMEMYAEMQRGDRLVPLPPQLTRAAEGRRVVSKIAGWNSWAITAGHWGQPTPENLNAATDVLADLRPRGFGPKQYITRDAVYGLTESETKAWIEHAQRSGSGGGSYDGPFAWYHNDQKNIGCDGHECPDPTRPGCWRVVDMLLKKASGCNASTLEGCLPSLSNPTAFIRDPTHPATQCILKNKVDASMALG